MSEALYPMLGPYLQEILGKQISGFYFRETRIQHRKYPKQERDDQNLLGNIREMFTRISLLAVPI